MALRKGENMAKAKPKGNKYDAPFMNMPKGMAEKVWGQSTPKKKKTDKKK